MKKYGSVFLLLLIIIFAFVIRTFRLADIPPSLNADEVAIGYNAYSILKTGKDEFNMRLPLVFRSFDDYKMPVYIYLTVPSIAVFGLTDFAVRFPSALFGTLSVLLVFLLVGELFPKSKNQGFLTHVPILASLLLAISPWHLQFSRSAYEANVALFFVILGVYFLVRGVSKGWYFFLASFALSLSVWSYHSSRVFIPVFCLGFAVLYRKELWKQKLYVVVSAVLGLCLLLPLLRLSLSKEGQMRALGVSILTNAAIPGRYTQWMAHDYATLSIPRVLATSIHNRRLALIPSIIKGYFEHYSLNFYFSESVLEKYHAPGVGLLYLWELPFILYGMYVLFRSKKKSAALLFWWFLVAPLAASVTEQLPHPVRTLVFLPTFQIFTAVGVLSFAEFLQQKRTWMRTIGCVSIGSALVISFSYYLHQYYVHLPIDYSEAWQYGRKEAVLEVKKVQSEYDEVIVSTSLDVPHIFFLYYLKYDPARYQKEGGTISGGFNEDRNAFDKYAFHPIKSFINPNKKTLYVGMGYEMPKGAVIIKTIYYKNGVAAFYIFTLPFFTPVSSNEATMY